LAVYARIKGDSPSDVYIQALLSNMRPSLTSSRQLRKAQGFKSVKMDAIEEGLGRLDSPSAISTTVERLRAVKYAGLGVGLGFHGQIHKPMVKQLAKLF